jgi:hypothetical protein
MRIGSGGLPSGGWRHGATTLPDSNIITVDLLTLDAEHNYSLATAASIICRLYDAIYLYLLFKCKRLQLKLALLNIFS